MTTSEVSERAATVNLAVSIDNDSSEATTIRVESEIFLLNEAGQRTGRRVRRFEP